MTEPDLIARAHNVHNGSGKPADAARLFADQMRDLGAHVAVATEAKALVPYLRSIAQHRGLEVVTETPRRTVASQPVPEEGDTAILVADDLVRKTATKVMRHRWVVRRYNRWHDPRRDQVVLTKGAVRGVRGIHLPPGGPDGANGQAWAQQMTAALQWAARGGCRVVIGDINCSTARLRKFLDDYTGKHANRIRSAQVTGHGVDLCVVIDGTAAAVKLDKAGSDHPAVAYAITAHGRVAGLRRWLRRRVKKARV